MDSSLFGAVRAAPGSCDERGKRLKEETDSELESRLDSTLSEEAEEKIMMCSRYHDNLYPCFLVGSEYVVNPSLKKEDEETEKALAEYWEKSEGVSPFDAIPVPRMANVCGNNFPKRLKLTEERLPRFNGLSQRALEYYNANNQGESYEFVKLVRVVSQHVPLGTYYITFKAKPTNATDGDHPSKRKAETFQAHVCALDKEQPVVSCSIKIKT